MRKRNVLAVGMAMAVALAVETAAGKAWEFREKLPAEGIFAVVSKIHYSDNAGDSDLNIYFRPVYRVGPSGQHGPVDQRVAEEYWSHFWDPTNTTWSDFMARAVSQARSRGWSQTCLACSSGEAATCPMTPGQSYATNPCPKTLSCRPCIDDMKRNPQRRQCEGIEIFSCDNDGHDDFMVKAEVFFGANSDDLNPALEGIGEALGADRAPECDEMSGDQGPDSMCGKRVLVNGIFTLEQMHGFRPEIHPVSWIIVDRSWGREADWPEVVPGQRPWSPGRFAVAAFVDGSHDPLSCPLPILCGIASSFCGLAGSILGGIIGRWLDLWPGWRETGIARGVRDLSGPVLEELCYSACCLGMGGFGRWWMYSYRRHLPTEEDRFEMRPNPATGMADPSLPRRYFPSYPNTVTIPSEAFSRLFLDDEPCPVVVCGNETRVCRREGGACWYCPPGSGGPCQSCSGATSQGCQRYEVKRPEGDCSLTQGLITSGTSGVSSVTSCERGRFPAVTATMDPFAGSSIRSTDTGGGLLGAAWFGTGTAGWRSMGTNQIRLTRPREDTPGGYLVRANTQPRAVQAAEEHYQRQRRQAAQPSSAASRTFQMEAAVRTRGARGAICEKPPVLATQLFSGTAATGLVAVAQPACEVLSSGTGKTPPKAASERACPPGLPCDRGGESGGAGIEGRWFRLTARGRAFSERTSAGGGTFDPSANWEAGYFGRDAFPILGYLYPVAERGGFPAGQGPNRDFEFPVWFSVRSGSTPNMCYARDLGVRLTAVNERGQRVTMAGDTRRLTVPRPTARLDLTNIQLSVPPLDSSTRRPSGPPRFTADVRVAATGFCPGDVTADWWLGERPLSGLPGGRWVGRYQPLTQPIRIDVPLDGVQPVGVLVSGPGGEAATATRVFRNGPFRVQTEVRCADERRTVKQPVFKQGDATLVRLGEARLANLPPAGICRELVITALATDVNGDFPPLSAVGNMFRWDEMRYFDETRGTWSAMASNWYRIEPSDNGSSSVLRVLPPQVLRSRYAVSVTATDLWGRTATSNINVSNDFSTPEDLDARLTSIAQTIGWRATAVPCAGPRCFRPDALTRQFASLRSRIALARGRAFLMSGLRDSVDVFTETAIEFKRGRSAVMRSAKWQPSYRVVPTSAPSLRHLKEQSLMGFLRAVETRPSRQ